MGLNDIMARLKEPKATQPTPTEQGLILSRLQLDRITEALRIAKRSREAELRIVKRTKSERRIKHKWWKGIDVDTHSQPYRAIDSNNEIEQWQKDLATWSNEHMLVNIPFADYMPRKGFYCRTYLEAYNKAQNDTKKISKINDSV